MADKIFDLLERMYIEMQEMKGDMQEMKSNMATKQDMVKLESKMDANHKALYDGYQQNRKNRDGSLLS